MAKPKRKCSVEGCDRWHHGNGFCTMHWRRVRKNGSTETTLRERGLALATFKESMVGPFPDSCMIWPHCRNGSGYGYIWAEGQRFGVHRYTCLVTLGAPPTPEHVAAHSCGNGHLGCFNPLHLRWATTSDNFADKLIHGTHTCGESHPRSKITEAQAREIRGLRGVEAQRATADRFGISQQQVSRIQSGKKWAHGESALV